MIKWTHTNRRTLTYSHDAAEVVAFVTRHENAPSAVEYRYEVSQFGRVLAEGATATQANARVQASQWIATAVEAATGEAL